jgi:hypothetical protein
MHLAKWLTKLNPLKLIVMNIFSALRVYAGKWQVKNTRSFSADEIAAVDSATVVDSQFGQSVCFMMKSGGQTYIPLDQNSNRATGDSIDLSKASVVTLSKPGEADIYRINC